MNESESLRTMGCDSSREDYLNSTENMLKARANLRRKYLIEHAGVEDMLRILFKKHLDSLDDFEILKLYVDLDIENESEYITD